MIAPARGSRPGQGRTARRRASPALLLRATLLAIFAVGAIWLSVAVGIAGLFRTRQPELVLDFFAADARARAALAEATIAQEGVAGIRKSAVLARSALRRDPTVSAAWRTLGLQAALVGDEARAAKYFLIAASLSLRDTAAQLWLIEERVRNNDVEGALYHYDIAMRASAQAQDVLIPVLVSATSEPHLIEPLAQLLVRDPSWKVAYYRALLRPPSTGAGGGALVETIRRLDPRSDLTELRPLPALIVSNGRYPEALRAYVAISGGDAADGELVRNGGFERANVTPALEWELTSTSELLAEPGPAEGANGDAALYARAEFGAQGSVARQLLVLEPGEYRFRSIAGRGSGPAPARLSWRVVCADGAATPILDLVVNLTGTQQRDVRSMFQVPANCPGQWLSLEIAAGDVAEGAEAWVDAVAIERLPS